MNEPLVAGVEGGDAAATRAGMVALVGRPNAGKSTLLNALIGEKLSIVTPREQTTRERVLGILTERSVQAIFVDTPGLLDVRDLLQRSMLEEALGAVREADVVLLVLDASRPLRGGEEEALVSALRERRGPLVSAVNKVDMAESSTVEERALWVEARLGGRAFAVSATEGTGLGLLRDALEEALPPSAFLYPEDEIATQPVRFFVSELVRETVFELYREEIPYSVFCLVEEFRETQDPVYVRVILFVERPTQKRILVGEGGRAIRALGTVARGKVEHLIGRPVYLDLWVKTLPGWRRKRGHLSRLGFHVPKDHERTP